MLTCDDINADAIVNDVLRCYPGTVSVFNTFGIDACCGGALPLGEAARRHGMDLAALLDALRRAAVETA